MTEANLLNEYYHRMAQYWGTPAVMIQSTIVKNGQDILEGLIKLGFSYEISVHRMREVLIQLNIMEVSYGRNKIRLSPKKQR